MKKLIKVGSAMALLAPGIAVAQTADQSGGVIIVTAQKRETRIVDVPAAIIVVCGEQLSDNGVANFEDLTSQVEIGRAQVRTPVTNAHLVCCLLHATINTTIHRLFI